MIMASSVEYCQCPLSCAPDWNADLQSQVCGTLVHHSRLERCDLTDDTRPLSLTKHCSLLIIGSQCPVKVLTSYSYGHVMYRSISADWNTVTWLTADDQCH